MKKSRLRSIMATMLTMCTLFNVCALPAMAASEEITSDGAVFTKTAKINSDGTVDITMEAYTTGVVKQQNIVTPADIILVLDVSGSMDDPAYGATNMYKQVRGEEYTYYEYVLFFPVDRTAYGLGDDQNFYISDGNGGYVEVEHSGRDSNSYDYYTDGTSYYYPELAQGVAANRNNAYSVVQFYEASTHMEVLKHGADAFIAKTADANADIADAGKKHRISIVKFGSDEYYDGSEGTTTIDNAVIGDDKMSNGYNYTQVVKDFTVVEGAGETELIDAMNSLTAGGATAVDYGMNLAARQFGKRTAEEAEQRKEVVIVFTDGAPTHSNSYSQTVAGAAIATANGFKNAGITVYSIGGADNADSTQLGDSANQFMHYISNNYPDANYTGGSIVSGTGNINAGYYMTPNDDKNLDDIFIGIMDDISASTITLGAEAKVIDTISEYFTIPNGTNSVTLQIADKTAAGWGNPYAATGVTASVAEQTLTVTGFDFDANYVSTDARANNFYGRKLIITVNVTPDYNEIDAHYDTIAANGGKIETNEGVAELVNSAGAAVATKNSPTVQSRKVTYKVDGEETKSVYRLPGSSVTVDPNPTKEGYTFSGWDKTGAFTMPDEDVVISGTFTAKKYNVTYEFSGIQPDGVTATIPANYASEETYGTQVTIKAPLSQTGYVFKGWYPQQTDVTIDEGKFTMPAKDVKLLGYFEPGTATPYKVEHYLETLTDGVYETAPALVDDGFTGVTGHTVTATPLNRFEGFEYNAAKSASTISGTIKSDGSLVLKVYYDRIEYEVTYGFEGDTDIPNLPTLPTGGTYKYGKEVMVANKAIAPAGYSFTGWYRGTADTPVEGTFIMPAYNVHLLGYFTANDNTEYKVEHYLMKADGTYPATYADTENFVGVTGHTVTAQPLVKYTGFEYDDAESTATKTGVIAGDGSLVLKLYYARKEYKVAYKYEGELPAGVTTPGIAEAQYRHGVTVTVENAPVAPSGYTFVGWYIGTDHDTILTEFEMPARDVELLGYFAPNNGTKYTVKHYLMKADGTYPTADNEYEDIEEFTGVTGHTVTAQPLVKYVGYEYDELTSASTKTGTIAGDGGLVLKLYYARKEYKVTYKYEGDLPDGVTTPGIAEAQYRHGVTVTVEGAPAAPAGYIFVGWYMGTDHDTILTEFEMPARDVELLGYFKANSNVAYEVHHYLETLTDGVYETEPEVVEPFSGTTGHPVTATPLNRFEGFEYNAHESAGTISGNILGDGSLVLKVYYDRKGYNITYGYEGDLTDITLPALPVDNNTYKYGADVPVAAKATAPAGYTFVGWYRGTVDNHVEGTFAMPAYNVHLLGQFVKNTNTPYRVEHYLQNIDKSGYIRDGEGETRHGTTGANVSALNKEYPGFEYNPGKSSPSGTIAGDGSLVLKFYYDRIDYQVTYLFDGSQPHGITVTIPADYNSVETYGNTVAVKSALSQEGYTFSGWTTTQATISDGKFSMPAKPVTLKGKFTANTNTPYRVEYYLQKLNAQKNAVVDEYELKEAYDATGISGHHVMAEARAFDGFRLRDDNVISAHIAGDGTTVIRVYYDRELFNVAYSYYGEAPECAPSIPAAYNKTGVPYGAELSIEAEVECGHHTHEFTGWNWSNPNITVDNGKYTMPNVTNTDKTLHIYGAFYHKHSVAYDLNGGTGEEGVDYSTEYVVHGTVVTVKAAPTKYRHTFTGWSDGTKTYSSEDDISVTADITLTAQWSANGGGGGGGTSVKYTLTYVSNGGTEFEDERYSSGKLVELEKVPVKPGYVFNGWHLDETLNEDVEQVKMTKNITVYADWVEDNGNAGNGHDTPDSLNGDDHFAYVVGYPDATVRPNANITRAEVTAIFFRLLNPDLRAGSLTSTNVFDDVDADDWFNKNVSTMAELGIVKGRKEDKFVPNAYITRAEFAAICARFDNSEYEVIDKFTDVSDHWAEDYIHEAAAHGWIRGYEDNTFKPDRYITRAEAMTMINRVLNRVPETKNDLLTDMIKWPDNSDESVWYYLPVQEATNSHEYKMKNNVYEKWTEIKDATDWTIYQ